MNLKTVRITEFQSIRDSGEFEIGDITCLVGKNESGKTALLQALYKLNPIIELHKNYSVIDDYPRWDVEDYRIDVENGKKDQAIVAMAKFELDKDDLTEVSKLIGNKGLKNNLLVLKKGYNNDLYFTIEVDEKEALKYVINQYRFTPDVKDKLDKFKNIDDVIELLSSEEQTESVQSVLSTLNEVKEKTSWSLYIYENAIKNRVPKFLYYDEYYQMKGCANIDSLKERKRTGKYLESDYPLLGLINRARLDLDELTNVSRTRELKNNLEGAGNYLTKGVIKHWSQNRYLQLKFDIRPAQPQDPDGMRQGTNIWCDVYDSKHMVTTELGTRSRGFVWFFSFLAWYGEIVRDNKNVILLLDEPGLYLHAKAQEDLLNYFEAEIKGKNQLIYTTHSPFMVYPSNFQRVRIVQDISIESKGGNLPPEQEGTKVLTDVLEATGDTLFPLQGALGYELYQTLFVGPNSLVVEGSSDLLYIQSISSMLEEVGRVGLDQKWIITPVGGSDKVPTFVALIGAQKHLNVAVLIDYQTKDRQTIENLYVKKLLKKNNVITFAEFTNTAEADIEDMFEPDFYIRLINREFQQYLQKTILVSELPVDIRIVQRINKYFTLHPLNNVTFNHFRPARLFAENLQEYKNEISPITLDRFENAFKKLNNLIK